MPELDETTGTAIEDQIGTFFDQLTGRELSDEVAEELDRQRPNVVIIDCMQMAAFNAAETRPVKTVALVHYPTFTTRSSSFLRTAVAISKSFDQTTVDVQRSCWVRGVQRTSDVTPNPGGRGHGFVAVSTGGGDRTSNRYTYVQMTLDRSEAARTADPSNTVLSSCVAGAGSATWISSGPSGGSGYTQTLSVHPLPPPPAPASPT